MSIEKITRAEDFAMSLWKANGNNLEGFQFRRNTLKIIKQRDAQHKLIKDAEIGELREYMRGRSAKAIEFAKKWDEAKLEIKRLRVLYIQKVPKLQTDLFKANREISKLRALLMITRSCCTDQNLGTKTITLVNQQDFPDQKLSEAIDIALARTEPT